MTKDKATVAVATHFKNLGIPLTIISEKSGVPYGAVYGSLGRMTRSLRAGEFLAICESQNIDPKQLVLLNDSESVTKERS